MKDSLVKPCAVENPENRSEDKQVNSSSPERWLEQYGDELFRIACFRIRNKGAAEDLVQETLLAALSSRHRYRGDSSERIWLIGILRHKIIDHIRKQARIQPQIDDPDEETLDYLFNKQGRWRKGASSWMPDPTYLLEQEEFWKTFYTCLEKLPERLAEAFSLKMIDEIDTDEICKVLDVSATNLWVIMHRARLKLRGCLEQNWFALNREGAR